jgi:Holliday junction resolvase RusA-like endonuclease
VPDRLHFIIMGVAAPKGSTRAFVVRKKGETGPGRAVIVPDNKAPARLWAGAVQEAASRAVQEQRQGQPILGPVRVRVVFHLPRPKSLKRGVLEHTKKPDADKLARNVGDALRQIAYEDDASVVEWAIRKCYAVDAPHADIFVEAVDGPLLEKPTPIARAGALFG